LLRLQKKKGLKEVAQTFKLIALVEERHEKRYRKLYDNVKK